MWYVVYSNGTTKQEAYDHNWINGTSTFNKTLTLEVTQVICAASLWNVNDWRNASVNVTVQNFLNSFPSR
ncbi:unnamed protein product [Allacma fusca]|uniref:Uncharacterized protein n=1 Tax=Allacma fusca TaxID=39272 RepID=A0A8J2PK98_9HEXA|nr:unnamed protein product [Allacma fusca]